MMLNAIRTRAIRTAIYAAAAWMLAWCVLPGAARAAEPKSDAGKAGPTSRPVIYHPGHSHGSASSSSPGGIRGSVPLPFVSVLVPDRQGVTTEARPTLYWYQSAKPAPGILAVLTVVKVRPDGNVEPEPLVELRINAQQAGICKFDLAKAKTTSGEEVVLKPDQDYRWTIALVPNPKERSQDSSDTADLRCVAAPAELNAAADAYSKAAAAAEAGLWYDALAALSRAVEQNPRDPALRLTRASFLEAAAKAQHPVPPAFDGLERAAEIDREAAK